MEVSKQDERKLNDNKISIKFYKNPSLKICSRCERFHQGAGPVRGRRGAGTMCLQRGGEGSWGTCGLLHQRQESVEERQQMRVPEPRGRQAPAGHTQHQDGGHGDGGGQDTLQQGGPDADE